MASEVFFLKKHSRSIAGTTPTTGTHPMVPGCCIVTEVATAMAE
jgi:hypothetical protein